MMRGNLLNTLATTEPTESVGADTASRFDYQKNWAFCEMLDRHMAGDDYLVAFEFHEDVLFLRPESSPTHVDFCQVKTVTSTKPKTLASITAPGKGRSILAKLIDNAAFIEDADAVRIILVCNGPYDFTAASACARDLEEKHRIKLIRRLKAEFPDLDDDMLPRMHFFVTDVPVQGMQTFLQGKVLELFKDRFGEDFGVNVFTWIRLVQGEITRRNNYPSDQIDSVEDLVEKKCIGRSEIDETLSDVHSRHRKGIDTSTITTVLTAEGWGAAGTMRLIKALPTALSNFQDPTNDECARLCRKIARYIDTLDLENATLSSILDGTRSTLSSAGEIPAPYREPSMVNALTLLVYDEKLQF